MRPSSVGSAQAKWIWWYVLSGKSPLPGYAGRGGASVRRLEGVPGGHTPSRTSGPPPLRTP
ncbi:hypothetical protein GCM10026982_29040 [Nocardiopsis aegyptia]